MQPTLTLNSPGSFKQDVFHFSLLTKLRPCREQPVDSVVEDSHLSETVQQQFK